MEGVTLVNVNGQKFRLEHRRLKDEMPGLYTDCRKKYWFIWKCNEHGDFVYRGYVNTLRTAKEFMYKMSKR